MSHLSELGRLGLGSRMKRFSDYMIAEVNAMYKEAGIEFEASCFPLLTLLERYGSMSLREAEQRLGTSHSYISQRAKSLEQQHLIEIKISKKDARSKNLLLTAKGLALIEQVRPLWKAMDVTFAAILGDDERRIFQALSMLEEKFMGQRPLRTRITESLASTQKDVDDIRIVDYDPAYKEVFANLNLEWLEKNFELQDFDKAAFADPEATILKKGGDIFFALHQNQPIATAALYPEGNNFELCKMGVDPRFRGMGIGKLLIEEAIKRTHKLKGEKITLLTNTHKLAPALRLYQSMGFREIPMTKEDTKKYGQSRVNIRMEFHIVE